MLLAGKNTVQGRLNLIIVGMIEAFSIFAYISCPYVWLKWCIFINTAVCGKQDYAEVIFKFKLAEIPLF